VLQDPYLRNQQPSDLLSDQRIFSSLNIKYYIIIFMRAVVPENGVLYGGLNTSKKSLKIAAAAIKRAGFIQPHGRMDTFTLGEAGRDREGVVAAAEGRLVVFQSMGHLASGPIVDSEVEPAGALSLNRIVPQTLPELGEGAGVRFERHAVRSIKGPDVQGHRRIVRDNVMVPLEDWSGNIDRVPEAEDFDGDYYLLELAKRTSLLAVISSIDEFKGFRHPIKGQINQVIDLRRCHDGIFYDAIGTLNLVSEQRVLPQLSFE
jgi:hypothetical protein